MGLRVVERRSKPLLKEAFLFHLFALLGSVMTA